MKKRSNHQTTPTSRLSKNFIHVVLVFLFVLALFISCKKSAIPPGGGGGGGGPTDSTDTTKLIYEFGDPALVSIDQPILIDNSSLRTGYFANQVASVSEDLLIDKVTFTPTMVIAPGDTTEMSFAGSVNRNGQEEFFESLGANPPDFNSNFVNAYSADPKGENIYFQTGGNIYPSIHGLYRFNLQNSIITMLAHSMGNAHCIKVASAGQVIIASDTLNGSLLSFDRNGVLTVIASGLGASPGIFDIHDNNFYVVLNTSTVGSVVKVTPSGVVTTVLNDLNGPTNICFDNNDNFVLGLSENVSGVNRTLTSYSIYAENGKKIADVTDAAGTKIYCILFPTVTGTTTSLFAPLYIDEFNNLYFNAYGSGYALLDPSTGSNVEELYKLSMVKK